MKCTCFKRVNASYYYIVCDTKYIKEKCVFRCMFIFCMFSVLICVYAVSTTSCLLVWWKRVGGGRSESCARLLWQVPLV